MASHRLSGQDKKDLEKFSKYLVYKCIQIIVQSRLGERVRTNSRPHSTGADWFNLAIKDIPEVTSETKKVLTSQSQILPIGQQLCVEISLKTTDGDILVLEKWLICKDEEADHSAKVSYTVYNRMGTLLKSLFCITRVTPSYRLSRKQGPDTFIICYRVYTGEPQFEHLGEGYNSIKVGTVATPMGTITISGAYRTKLLISPQTISKDLSNELKDDHFNTDCSPRRYSPKPCVGGYRDRRPSIDSIVSESDMCATTFSNSPSHTSSDVSTPEHPTSKPINIQQTPSDTRLHEKAQLCVPEKPVLTLSQGQKQGAFAPQTHTSTPPRDSTDDIPFMSLLHYSQAIETPEITTNNANSNRPLDTTAKNTYHEKTKSESDPKSEHLDVDAISSSTESKGSSKSENKSSAADDFVMVELKAPFAGREMQSDLGRFYRDCQTAPQLEMFQEPPNIDVALNQISDQLAAFESNLDDIDSFVDSVISLEDA